MIKIFKQLLSLTHPEIVLLGTNLLHNIVFRKNVILQISLRITCFTFFLSPRVGEKNIAECVVRGSE